MSRTEIRALAWIGVAALILRVGAALLTEAHPLFPAYYYADALMTNEHAAAAFAAAHGGPPYDYKGVLSHLIGVREQVAVYGLIGVHPVAMKLINSVLGAAAVVALGAAAACAFDPAFALAAAALCAVWPSDVFYTSQNLKESPTNFLVYAALACGLALATKQVAASKKSLLFAVLTCGALVGAGFYRSYVMLVLAAALILVYLLDMAKTRTLTRNAAFGLLAVLLGLAAYRPLSRGTMNRFYPAGAPGDPRLETPLIPVSYDSTSPEAATYRPTSLHGLAEFRRLRQYSDRVYAKNIENREIATQILPGAALDTWRDLAVFLPKSAFEVLFMPLPGLYPMDGKLGRIFASGENLILLILAVLGIAGAVRGRWTPARLGFLAFFAAMTLGSALLEFDLGSAGRHKLLYLPMLFPFAAEEAARLFGRKEPA
ncbi:MAG: hypothetical protein KGJ84_14980 [Elusimicrobia bacterium]|nr:hypothetical protein [Elusimicrobiota bacterium]